MRPYHCSTCGKSFRQSSTLKSHIRLHSEKPFRCQLCNKVFLRHSTLVRHEFGHTGEKPFECDICKATFAFKSYLTYHKRTKHLGTKVRTKVCCPKCGRELSDRNGLRKHLVTHTGKSTLYSKLRWGGGGGALDHVPFLCQQPLCSAKSGLENDLVLTDDVLNR